MDYYKILELSPECTAKQVQKQFRKFAKQYHPDKHKGNDIHTDKFHKIQEAYKLAKNHY